MDILFRAFDRACQILIRLLLRLALALDNIRRRIPRRLRKLRGSLRRMRKRWLDRQGAAPSHPRHRRGRRAADRTPEHLEDKLVRLHVEQPQLGAGQLRYLAERVLAFSPARETVRRILMRRRDLVVALDQQRRKRRRRISVRGAGHLWGADLTLVWILGFFPVWLLGIVDYHGSHLVALERVRWPSGVEVARVFERAFIESGAPLRVLTDRGAVFGSPPVRAVFAAKHVGHTTTWPAHPWTNGRIERIFGTYKRTVFGLIWLFSSLPQVDRFAADFLRWYNADRPHSSWGGRTPDEVHFGRPKRIPPRPERVAYFDGRLLWWKFG